MRLTRLVGTRRRSNAGTRGMTRTGSAGGRGRWWKRAVIAAALLLIVAALWWVAGGSSRVLYDGSSDFGRIRVVERWDGLRSLYTGAGRARQSAVYPGRPDHLVSTYTRVAAVGLALVPASGRILYVGLGGGSMPMHAREILPLASIDVVEIDPRIVEVAQQYFGFRPDPSLRVHVGDGRAFIEATPPGSYDLIVLDAFSDDEIPFSLTTLEFLQAVGSALEPNGIVVANLWGSAPLYRRMVATYDAAFREVHLVRVRPGSQRILIATNRAEPLSGGSIYRSAEAFSERVSLGFDLAALVDRGYEGRGRGRGAVLRDGERPEPLSLADPHPVFREPLPRHRRRLLASGRIARSGGGRLPLPARPHRQPDPAAR
jgi:spermidine synthase